MRHSLGVMGKKIIATQKDAAGFFLEVGRRGVEPEAPKDCCLKRAAPIGPSPLNNSAVLPVHPPLYLCLPDHQQAPTVPQKNLLCCGILRHSAAFCGILRHSAACCGILRHSAACCGILRHSAAMLRHSVACCGMLQAVGGGYLIFQKASKVANRHITHKPWVSVQHRYCPMPSPIAHCKQSANSLWYSWLSPCSSWVVLSPRQWVQQ